MKKISIIILTTLVFIPIFSSYIFATPCTDNSQCQTESDRETYTGCNYQSTGVLGQFEYVCVIDNRTPCQNNDDCNATNLSQHTGCSFDVNRYYCAEHDDRPNIVVLASNEGPCIDGDCSAINTALGPLSTNPTDFVGDIITFSIGIGGGIALLLMLYGFFIITTSSGIPDKIKAGQEIITSAIGGLIFIIFSVILMRIIGVDILGIPGL